MRLVRVELQGHLVMGVKFTREKQQQQHSSPEVETIRMHVSPVVQEPLEVLEQVILVLVYEAFHRVTTGNKVKALC